MHPMFTLGDQYVSASLVWTVTELDTDETYTGWDMFTLTTMMASALTVSRDEFERMVNNGYLTFVGRMALAA